MTYDIHPCAQYFDIEPEEQAEMDESIASNGQLMPITIWQAADGRFFLTDGRTRAHSCEKLGITPEYRFIRGTEQEAIDDSWSLNKHRRHASVARRALAAARMATATGGGNRTTPPIGGVVTPTVKEAAEKFGVSERQVSRAKRLGNLCSPAMYEVVRDEVIKLAKAEEYISKPWSIQDQIAATERQAHEAKKTAKQNARAGKVTVDVFTALKKSINNAIKKLNKALRRHKSDDSGHAEDIRHKLTDASFLVTEWQVECEPKHKERTPPTIYDHAENPNGRGDPTDDGNNPTLQEAGTDGAPAVLTDTAPAPA